MVCPVAKLTVARLEEEQRIYESLGCVSPFPVTPATERLVRISEEHYSIEQLRECSRYIEEVCHLSSSSG